MSWVATALYVPGIMALGYLVEKKFEDAAITPLWQCLLVFLIFALFALLVFMFVYRQFKLRSRAADVVAALIELLNEVSKDEKVVESWSTEIKGNKVWPEFIENKVVPGKGRNILTKLTTDGVCYAAIIFSTVIALLLVCI